MTPEQRAELEQLDAAIAANPRDNARTKRVLLRAKLGADVAWLCAEWELVVRHSYGADTARVLQMGHQHFHDARKVGHRFLKNLGPAMASAHILIVLETQPDAEKWISREVVMELCQLDDIEAIWDLVEDSMDEDEDETPAMWKTLALVFAVVGGLARAAHLYLQALQLEIEDGLWPDWERAGIERARDQTLLLHEQLAWFDAMIEAAPDRLDWLLERAAWHQGQHRFASALADFDRALELRPDDPTLWERRGAHRLSRSLDQKNPIEAVFADYQGALRLRVAAGESGYVHDLQTRGDAILCEAKRDRPDQFRAHAYYSLAIEQKPDAARLYLRRAGTLRYHALRQRASPEAEAAYADMMRALALQPTLDAARKGIVEHLRQTLGRPTAHERMEALLEARDVLVAGGVQGALASAIVGEVERALSA